jgi:hypothetical protein
MSTDTDEKVLHAMEAATQPQDNLIHLSTGVILRGRQAPPLTLMTIMAAFPRPKVPVVFIESMGREMENPDNPDYQERVKEWKTEQSNAMLVALIATGTELYECPPGMPGPDDSEWMDEYSLLSLPMHRENKAWRYLRWVQYKAAISADDTQKIMKVVGRLSGVPESAAKTAEEFPGGNQKGR